MISQPPSQAGAKWARRAILDGPDGDVIRGARSKAGHTNHPNRHLDERDSESELARWD